MFRRRCDDVFLSSKQRQGQKITQADQVCAQKKSYGMELQTKRNDRHGGRLAHDTNVFAKVQINRH